MDRRSFIVRGALLSGGLMVFPSWVTAKAYAAKSGGKAEEAYALFRTPESRYRPFVRWWWNGNRVQPEELIRELRLLKEAGIGGVEINPVKFPDNTDDLGIPSLEWLGDEWIDA
ncbi:MAG: glycoside hydrolase family 2, partial [Tannerella sp.]|nr:glycoside hydrolase family 2 [Tannerella sp.]